MNYYDLRKAVRRYLALIDEDPSDPTDLEDQLVEILNELVFRVPKSIASPSDDDHEPEVASYEDVRSRVMRRFPDFGLYNVPSSITSDIGGSDCMVGDAIDDLTDIYQELAEVEWLWENVSEEEAIWVLRLGFDAHWERHLRNIQIYLLARRKDDP